MPTPVFTVQNAPIETAAIIMQEAAIWLLGQSQPLWQPADLTPAKLSRHSQPHEVFVGWVDSQPAVAALIQERDTLLWPDDHSALYVHKLSVKRAFAGQGFPARLLDWACQRAQGAGKRFLRLDCAADRPKLCAYYEQQGFARVDTRTIGPFKIALYEKALIHPRTPA